ncbi:MAG: hypothetical protein CL573_01145 [Alphaproteobacteria bacterium]|nr:hypothetical protein [Alphaproteobacteria bacterium]
MGTLIFLKFCSLNEAEKVLDLSKRGWKVRPAGEENDGTPIFALHINDGDEKELHELRCPACIMWAIEVHSLDHEFLTCPGCGSEIKTEDWITEEQFQEMFEDEYDLGA